MLSHQKARHSNRDTDALMEKLTEQVSAPAAKEIRLRECPEGFREDPREETENVSTLNVEKESIKRKADQEIERLVDERIREINRIWESQQGSKNPSLSYSQVSETEN